MNLTKRWCTYLLVIALLIAVTVEIPIIAAGKTTKPVPADVLIILGAKLAGREPGAMLRLRLDEALRLYQQGYAPQIIVSGAQGRDEEESEANAMRDYLVAHGVPAAAIHLEAASFNTYQNLANSRAIMAEQGFRRAIIVSSASHIHRALSLARLLHIDATAAPAPMADSLYLTVTQYLREGAAMLLLAASRQ